MNVKIKDKKKYSRLRIKMRVRKIVSGTQERPRMSVYRSNKEIYVQLIDDNAEKTLLAVSSKDKGVADQKITKIEQAKLVGGLMAEKAKEAGIVNVIFDRNGFLYHGRIKALADAARVGGLKF